LNSGLSTPQGQLASSETAIIGANNDLFAEFVNQVNPDIADGFMQDAVARIYFLTRRPATATVVTCTCTGLTGTVISVGATVKDASGNIYSCTTSGSIPTSGSIDLPFQNLVSGAIPCPAGSVTQIYQAVPGWDTVINAADGTIGIDVETRAEFEARRKRSVAINGLGSLQTVYAKVFEIPGVLDVYCCENKTSDAKIVGSSNYSLVPHSIYVAAVGGEQQDIADAIWRYSAGTGANYNGNTTVSVTDTGGYNYPYPTYEVTYQVPTSLPIYFAVNVVSNPALPANSAALIKSAIIAAFNGEDGGSRARIGSAIIAGRYYAGVQSVSPAAMQILSIDVGTSSNPTGTSVSVGIDQVPTISAGNIAVTFA
jgi:uncharacterized phage protein gp47/JayE